MSGAGVQVGGCAEVRQDRAARKLMINSEHRLRQENLAFDIDVWYPALQRFTFDTVFVPLTRTEAAAIIAFYSCRYTQRDQFVVINGDGVTTTTCKFTCDAVAVLKKLTASLDAIINSQFKKNGAFLRLCGRSTKDAEPLNRDRVLERFYAIQEEFTSSGDVSDASRANIRAAAASRALDLCVRSGEEAMSLLLSSERVFSDLIDWLEFGEPEQVVLQWSCYCYFPIEWLKPALLDYWSEVHPHVGEDTYVMDLAYLPSSRRVILIELSPFLTCTSAAMFRWQKDLPILENGPLEFRVRTKPYPQVDQIVDSWENRWHLRHDPYFAFFGRSKCICAGAICKHKFPLSLHWKSIFILITICGLLMYFCLSANSVPGFPWILLWVAGLALSLLGFHWNHKFLSKSHFIGEATTMDAFPLVIGQCGVPYLIYDPEVHDQGHQIYGELWEIDDETLMNLDEYEGIKKGHYMRRPIKTILGRGAKTGPTLTAFCYFSAKTTHHQILTVDLLPEYTMQHHQEIYKPIRHILVKQQMYLQTKLTTVDS
ncbi:hypothetical protein Pelo_9340 [Pelomyxa schiedti]|nr:hypothetical protein Pelo_9340 [Pelomyxa schiedti]